MAAAKRKKARDLTTDEVIARVFGPKAAKKLRQLAEGDKSLKRKIKPAAPDK